MEANIYSSGREIGTRGTADRVAIIHNVLDDVGLRK